MQILPNLRAMCERYALEWLDSLITVSLNPAKSDLNTLSDEEIIALLHQYPKLIERPIIIDGERAIIARPLSVAQEWLKTAE